MERPRRSAVGGALRNWHQDGSAGTVTGRASVACPGDEVRKTHPTTRRRVSIVALVCLFVVVSALAGLFRSTLRVAASSSSSTTISTSGGDSLALKPDGTVWAWGYGGYGSLGDGSTADSATPVQVSGLGGVVAVSMGVGHALAVKSDGSVWAWGSNGNGELGNGSTTDTDAPVQSTGITQVIAVSAGNDFSLALKSDGTLWAWGWNAEGELGNGTTTQSTTPVQVTSLTGVSAIASGYRHALAVKSDGTAWAWGYNGYGELGNGTTTNSAVPVQVSGLSNVTAVAGGYYHSLALAADGGVWAWGENTSGQLGNGTSTNSDLPVRVSGLPGTSNATAVAAGVSHSNVLLANGTVWSWGDNNDGQLGNGSTTGTTVPVQTSTIASASQVAAGYYQSLAIEADGSVWAWGQNVYGQLGTGSTTTTGCACIDTPVKTLISVARPLPPSHVRAATDSSYVEVRWDQPPTAPSSYTVSLHCVAAGSQVVPDQRVSLPGAARSAGFQLQAPAYPSTCSATVLGSGTSVGVASNAVTVTGSNNSADVVYNGGVVQDNPGIYIMAWQPTQATADAAYDNYIKTFVQDLSGSAYFGIANEYYDATHLPTLPGSAVSVAGTATDTNAYPVDTVPTLFDTFSFLCGGSCVSGGDVQNEIQKDASTLGWTLDTNHTVLVLLEQGEGECTVVLGSPYECSGSAQNNYCAYHESSGTTVDAIIPYPSGSHGCAEFGTSSAANDRASAVYFAAHELIEAATDPTGGGWCNASGSALLIGCTGYEVADQCSTLLGSGDFTTVNFGADSYVLPFVWSDLGTLNTTAGSVPTKCFADTSW